ncbi:hypothetical protein E0504_32325 [Parafrankia sp. BMG5.11]|nr:hypothetical protein E0504_32325 [Parafrankia sp. BMG5.11]
MREYIARAGTDDAWLCRCGNSPGADGFVPVHRGREINPSSARWRGHYCCLTCGLLITWPTREIIGRIHFADLVLCGSAPCPKRRRRPSFPPRSRRVRQRRRARRSGPRQPHQPAPPR